MLGSMGEPEDADPAKVRSVIRGCGESGSIVYMTIRPLADGVSARREAKTCAYELTGSAFLPTPASRFSTSALSVFSHEKS